MNEPTPNQTGPEIRRSVQALIDENPPDLVQLLTDQIIRARHYASPPSQNQNQIPIESCSVKVMRSYDYCHFEICLGCNWVPLENEPITPAQVDELRKTAARLADKAVEQYKIAKVAAQRRLENAEKRRGEIQEIDDIKKLPEDYRTSEQKARLKAYDDRAYQLSREYDYQDDWEGEQP
jgi:hypothetical protein